MHKMESMCSPPPKELQDAEVKESKPKPVLDENSVVTEEPVQDMEGDLDAQQPQSEKPTVEEISETRTGTDEVMSVQDSPDVSIRFAEKRLRKFVCLPC